MATALSIFRLCITSYKTPLRHLVHARGGKMEELEERGRCVMEKAEKLPRNAKKRRNRVIDYDNHACFFFLSCSRKRGSLFFRHHTHLRLSLPLASNHPPAAVCSNVRSSTPKPTHPDRTATLLISLFFPPKDPW